ncbi:hypothetical protein Desde_1112 [Desulfitobacterium dehalogenans ATCC 51507]|uniref:Uncharacterized protein n=1 Tax=Desulfitobacterium dehalogenans (strain ATCC 51507 / DSM 9161 / JW/IU-DC1) TaxID=756499 RepID=I4A6G0_DESDJ|nr:hypothetical protein [Desulfitobacterium dehalogenans]AFL99544.1 hypothetical protein Desde_1112 [Desulfitobacterium dehalogenans ATCC 51507]
MVFSGYREDHRGNWFGGNQFIWVNDQEGKEKYKAKFYIVSEQNKHLIRVRDEKQQDLLYCMSGPHVTNAEIDWLLDKTKGGFAYYDSPEDYLKDFDDKYKV